MANKKGNPGTRVGNENALKLYKHSCDAAVFRASLGVLSVSPWIVNLYPHHFNEGEFVWLIWYGKKLEDIERSLVTGDVIREKTFEESCRIALNKLIQTRERLQ